MLYFILWKERNRTRIVYNKKSWTLEVNLMHFTTHQKYSDNLMSTQPPPIENPISILDAEIEPTLVWERIEQNWLRTDSATTTVLG